MRANGITLFFFQFCVISTADCGDNINLAVIRQFGETQHRQIVNMLAQNI
jgi:hypothetical protein